MKNLFVILFLKSTILFSQDGLFVGTSASTNQSCLFGQVESNFDKAFMRLEIGVNPINMYSHLTMKFGIRVAKYGDFKIYTNIPTIKFDCCGVSISPSIELKWKNWLALEIENERRNFIVALKIRKHLF